jgi:hypothetical protein
MKKIFTPLFVLLLAALSFSCKKDKAPDPRDIFVSIYSVTETWTENGQTISRPAFTMSVEKSTQQADKILLVNFSNYGAGITAEATVSGTSLTLSQQTLPNLKSVTGTGSLADPTLTITYTETVNNVAIAITATAKKK